MRISSILAGAAFCTLALAAPVASDAQPQPSKYSPLFDALWQTVDQAFYDPNFLGHDWKAIGDSYRARLDGVSTDAQFNALASAMLAELGTSHLYVIPPNTSSASGVGIGVKFRTIGGENLVSEIDPLSDARAKGVRIGDRLLSPLPMLSGPPGSVATVQLQSCTRVTRTLALKREGAFWPPAHPGFTWHRVEVGPKRSSGYLRIDRFDDGAAPLIDQAMAELTDTDGLIIDVRDNSGGNFSAARLVSYFSGPAQIAIALFARPYLEKLGHPVTAADVQTAPKVTGAYTDSAVFEGVSQNGGGAAFMTEDVGGKEYGKPVIVLVGADTGSAAEGFAWMMKRLTKATVAGHQTSGALLSGQELPLPGGWTVTVPVQGLWAADGTDFRDKALTPDVPVEWTRSEMCAGRDPDIEKALALLNSPPAP